MKKTIYSVTLRFPSNRYTGFSSDYKNFIEEETKEKTISRLKNFAKRAGLRLEDEGNNKYHLFDNYGLVVIARIEEREEEAYKNPNMNKSKFIL